MAPANPTRSTDEILRIGRLVTGILDRMLELRLVQEKQLEGLAEILFALLESVESVEE